MPRRFIVEGSPWLYLLRVTLTADATWWWIESSEFAPAEVDAESMACAPQHTDITAHGWMRPALERFLTYLETEPRTDDAAAHAPAAQEHNVVDSKTGVTRVVPGELFDRLVADRRWTLQAKRQP